MRNSADNVISFVGTEQKLIETHLLFSQQKQACIKGHYGQTKSSILVEEIFR